MKLIRRVIGWFEEPVAFMVLFCVVAVIAVAVYNYPVLWWAVITIVLMLLLDA